MSSFEAEPLDIGEDLDWIRSGEAVPERCDLVTWFPAGATPPEPIGALIEVLAAGNFGALGSCWRLTLAGDPQAMLHAARGIVESCGVLAIVTDETDVAPLGFMVQVEEGDEA